MGGRFGSVANGRRRSAMQTVDRAVRQRFLHCVETVGETNTRSNAQGRAVMDLLLNKPVSSSTWTSGSIASAYVLRGRGVL